MSAIIYLPGRPTSDPQIKQAKNGGTTYTTLDISCPQRGADGKKETVFYSCYFNSFLADRLIKAGVKKSTGLIIIGDLELHPFIHQKGKNQGMPNAGPSVIVKDWQFAPASYDENSGANAPVSSSKTGSLRLHPTMKIAEPIPACLAVCRKMAMDRVLIRTTMAPRAVIRLKMLTSSPARCRAAAILLPEGSRRAATSRHSQMATASRVPETTTASRRRMDISRITWQDRAPRRRRTTDICLQTGLPAV